MFNRSLRAVFRKESWMFCAGLLLSIADLLKVLRPPNTTLPLPQTPQGKFQSTACSSRTSAQGTRGDNLPPHRPISQGRAAQQVAASTIRGPHPLFNLEVAEKWLSSTM